MSRAIYRLLALERRRTRSRPLRGACVMSTTVYACGYFSPSQLSVLQSLLDDVTADQDVSSREREQLARTIISLAQIGVTSEDELRRMLRKATSDLLLESGQFRRSQLGQASLRGVMTFRQRRTASAATTRYLQPGFVGRVRFCVGRETVWDEGSASDPVSQRAAVWSLGWKERAWRPTLSDWPTT